MVHLQEADLLFAPAEVLASHFPPTNQGCFGTKQQSDFRIHLSANVCSKMSGLLPAQLEFSAEDEEVDIVPSFQVQDPVHDDMLTIAAVRFGRCPGAPGAGCWVLERKGADFGHLGILKCVQPCGSRGPLGRLGQARSRKCRCGWR